ncbi:MAG: FHA domain-containing protein, partial [Chloroflexota bacterium]
TPSAASIAAAKSAGQTCPKCGHINRAGILVCEKCGTLLIGDEQVGGTKRFEAEKQAAETAAQTAPKPSAAMETAEILSAAVSTAGSAQFTDNLVLRLEIEGAPTPILLHPKYETSLGRRDPATGTMPDVDLSAYAGYRLGVSRKHAIIRLKNERLEIYDLGSSNGTSVNGTRLTAHQPNVLRDGDELLLGKMMVRVLFQVRSRRT